MPGALLFPTMGTGTDYVNVATFGADKTGGADSTAAVQAALNSATSSQVVYFPSGNYLFNSTGLTMQSANTITGDNPTATTLTMGANFTGSSLISCNVFNYTTV